MIDRFDASRRCRARAVRHLAAGVSSTPRAAQLPVPICIDRAEGVILTDVDGNQYVDYALGYGPLFLGHSPACVMTAIRRELDRGLRTASVHEGEAELAELIASCVPSCEVSAFVSTGTEAVQLALRIARAVTGKTKVVKFRGHYHGWFDNVHVAGVPGRDGPVTQGQDTQASRSIVVLDWGDGADLEAVLTPDVAAVILEPAAINAGCFEAPAGFLEQARAMTARLGIVLIFDEILTGFRLALGGAQQRYRIAPDLTVLGKILGAGLPIAAVGGSRAMMEPVVSARLLHRGTFNGHPLSVAAGIACLQHLREGQHDIYPRTERFAASIRQHIEAEAERTGVAICARQVGPVVQILAGARRFDRLQDVGGVDRPATMRFAEHLLRRAIHIIPRGVMYLSDAHSEADIELTRRAITQAFDHTALT